LRHGQCSRRAERPPRTARVGWEFFGAELRLRREEAGCTQQELGDRVFCPDTCIGQFEAAVRKPQLDIAQRIDEELRTGGFFARMCEELINSSPFADCFVEVAELRTRATTICERAPLLVPGLLQVEACAKAITSESGRGQRPRSSPSSPSPKILRGISGELSIRPSPVRRKGERRGRPPSPQTEESPCRVT